MSASQQPAFANPYVTSMTMAPPASPGLPVNLGSNNPFRNRALSPASSANSGSRPERPTSTNPFLDDTDPLSPQSAPVGVTPFSPVDRPDMTGNTRELFANLSLNPTLPQPAQQPTGFRQAPPRPNNAPIKSPSTRAPPSRERSERHRPKDPLDIFADPPKTSSGRPRGDRERRPRRNSESSVIDRASKLLDTEDDQRRRERRRRERDARHGKSRSKKAHYQLDIIDKLDVTSIYGTGMFHHDGPFDACNPNRNRKGLRAAPMQAFPKDSSNMALGGAGPNNEKIDLNLFNGTMQEGYNDFASTGVSSRTEGGSFDPKSRIEPVHGPNSMGLGTSTFLEGAPASKTAMQRRASENENQIAGGMSSGGGLQRKKSLAQRLRGINRAPSGRVVSPEASYTVAAGSAGPGSARGNDKNPFFQDYDDAYEKKGAQIAQAPTELKRSQSAGSDKGAGLERRHTNEPTRSYTTTFDEGKTGGAAGGGFLNRMKSLRKPRPERRVTDE
ncbi:Pal1-domain-containing protein [Aspergillus taichungensis]|uniref:Pal1-domain-containing protein n=1 Tax=Aspergillus taichungensis TaxID=482145 RepID=A0A2J5I749_9EURO|nr:Pal1-domain-containing protein [Aspergillus taichungensis]